LLRHFDTLIQIFSGYSESGAEQTRSCGVGLPVCQDGRYPIGLVIARTLRRRSL
jgi:hypothetical protein